MIAGVQKYKSTRKRVSQGMIMLPNLYIDSLLQANAMIPDPPIGEGDDDDDDDGG